MPYRTDLKRPDLKGQFPCNVCGKVFCHSSSLSRHRMQAHFKSYTCTQCNQEIASSDTLRSHMYRYHQIQRMFMCRCCNWAFPDKTSLHIHMQSMQKSGMPGDVSVLARSSIDKEELMASIAGGQLHQREHDSSHPSFGSPSNNSSPDEEQQHDHQESGSLSPSLSEMEEQSQGRDQKTEVEAFGNEDILSRRQQPAGGGSIFPHQQNTEPNNLQQPNDPKVDFLMSRLGMKSAKLEVESCNFAGIPPPPPPSVQQQIMHPPPSQQQTSHQFASVHPSSAAASSLPSPPTHFIPQTASIFQQQWFAQWLANNPFFANALDNCLNSNNSNNEGREGESNNIKNKLAGVFAQQQQQQPNAAVLTNNSNQQQMRMLQSLFAAVCSAPSSPSIAPVGRSVPASHQLPNNANNFNAMPPQQQRTQPPQKKAKTTGKGSAQQQKPTKGSAQAVSDLSLHIPKQEMLGVPSPLGSVSNRSMASPTTGENRKLSSLINSLLQVKGSGQYSPAEGAPNKFDCSESGSERRNKRKARVPTRALEMAEIVYGDELEVFCEKTSGNELGQAVSGNVFPSIQRLMMEVQSHDNNPSAHGTEQPQQPSPAVSDSHTSGSSSNGVNGVIEAGDVLISPTTTNQKKGCSSCQQRNTLGINLEGASKSDRIRQIADRITAIAEQIEKPPKAKGELLDYARQLQLMLSCDS